MYGTQKDSDSDITDADHDLLRRLADLNMLFVEFQVRQDDLTYKPMVHKVLTYDLVQGVTPDRAFGCMQTVMAERELSKLFKTRNRAFLKEQIEGLGNEKGYSIHSTGDVMPTLWFHLKEYNPNTPWTKMVLVPHSVYSHNNYIKLLWYPKIISSWNRIQVCDACVAALMLSYDLHISLSDQTQCTITRCAVHRGADER